MKPGYFTPRPEKEGDAHVPTAVAPTPERSTVQHLLDIVVAIWHLRHGEVKDSTSGIPEAELVRGKPVKELLIMELSTHGVEVFGRGTRVVDGYDVGVDRVAVILIGPDGVTHHGYARAARSKDGLMTHKDVVWDPPTVVTSSAPPAGSWTVGMSGKAVPTVHARTPRPTPAPAPNWTAGMRG